MTRYEQGFMTKCAEHGVPTDVAGQMLNRIGTMRKSAQLDPEIDVNRLSRIVGDNDLAGILGLLGQRGTPHVSTNQVQRETPHVSTNQVDATDKFTFTPELINKFKKLQVYERQPKGSNARTPRRRRVYAR